MTAPTRTRTLAPADSAPAPAALRPVADGLEVGATLLAIQATGASFLEAIGLVAKAHGDEAALPLFTERLRRPGGRWKVAGSVVAALAEAAVTLPDLALMALLEWGRNTRIEGDLTLIGTWIEALPEGMTVQGRLILEDVALTALPAGLRVGGLFMNGATLTGLPTDLQVGEALFMQNTGIRSLPAGLRVGGDIYGDGSALEALPEGLWVGKSLHLRDCVNLDRLPDRLWVTGSLALSGTQVTAIPDGAVVGKSLMLSGCPIVSLPDGLVLGVKGDRNGNLDLNHTPIVTLPKRMFLSGNLELRGCLAWDGRISKGVQVGEMVYTDAHPGGVRLATWRADHPTGER
jgi:hypothetical protein